MPRGKKLARIVCYLVLCVICLLNISILHRTFTKEDNPATLLDDAPSYDHENTTTIITSSYPTTIEVTAVDTAMSYGEHRVQPALQQLPKWLVDYIQWHQSQIRLTDFSAADTNQYMVLSCWEWQKCGGFSDRLRALPFYLLLASKVQRLLCIHWSEPFGLEELLQPPKGGMDWRCPTYMPQAEDVRHYTLFRGREKIDTKQMVQTMIVDLQQNHDRFISIGGKDRDFEKINRLNNIFQANSYQKRYPVANKWNYVDLTQHIFRILFEPIPPILRRMKAVMEHHRLIEAKYTAIHVRGRYPTGRMQDIVGKSEAKDHDKGSHTLPFDGKLKDYLLKILENAVECAVQLLVDHDEPIFFSSDNTDLTEYALKHTFTIQNRNISLVGAIENRDEIQHLGAVHHLSSHDNNKTTDPSLFYPIIQDLFLMGGARCVAHGIGSFGAFGAGLTGNTCRVVHRKHSGKPVSCPNPSQKKIIDNVTVDLLLLDSTNNNDDGGKLDPAI